MPIITKDYTLVKNGKNLEVRLTFAVKSIQEENPSAEQITDIEIKLTREERRQVLCKLTDDKINFKNSAYTYVLQGFIAKYMGESEHELHELEKECGKKKHGFFDIFKKNPETKLEKMRETRKWAAYLHKLSTHFIPLEDFVNNAKGEPGNRLKEFGEKIEQFHNGILEDLDSYIKELPEDNPRKQILINLRKEIDDKALNFRKQIERLKENPSKQDVDCLLSIADRALFIKSLGTFMREEMSFILDAGIKGAYKISNNRLRDTIPVPRLVAYLSDAKHLMLIKGQSIVEGPKDNDTYSSMPKEMLNCLTGVAPLNDSEQLYFSIIPYLQKMHPKYIDEVLCLVTDKSRHDNSLHGNYFYHFILQPLKLVASIFEIGFSIPRILLVTSLGLVEFLLSPLAFASKPESSKMTWKINQYIGEFYDDFSFIFAPLTYLNNLEASRYKRTEIEIDDHQKIIDDCADYSSYCRKLFRYFTPNLVSEFIKDFFLSIKASVTNFFSDLKYLLEPASNNEEIYSKVAKRYMILKLMKQARESCAHAADDKSLAKDSYDKVVYCDSNNIKSPLDVFYEIVVVLTNDVVNPMFRKSPGLATFYFAVSMLTFGTLALPSSAFAWMKPLPTWLKYLANKISINFTGKPASAGLMEQSVACFLEWKLGFFSTEFAVEILDGHYEILEKLFEEPEQIVLGIVGLVGLGMGVGYIPELPSTIKIPGLPAMPNPYFIIINTFSEEQKATANGTLGLTSIETMFLGLKFGMILHSMLFNSEREEAKLTELEKLSLVLQQNNFLKRLLDHCKSNNLTAQNIDKNSIKPFINKELESLNVQFAEQAIDEFAKLLVSPYKTPIKRQTSAPTVADARAALVEAINMVADKENNLLLAPSIFGINKEAHQLYDYLDKLFEDYNAAILRENPENTGKCIDKRPFLDIFFNKYIYKRSNNFVRSLLIIFYPVPLVLRTLKYLWATITHKPSMQHQVIKNFSKDLVILAQVFTPIARMTADLALYVSGVLRSIAFLVAIPIAGLIFYPVNETIKYFNDKDNYKRTPFSRWFEVIDQFICKYIALHKTPALQPVRQLLVRASRVAGVNTNLKSVSEKVLFELQEEEAKQESYAKMNRPLRKLASDLNCAKTRSTEPQCTLVHEDSSTESTKQFKAEVEFPNRSNASLGQNSGQLKEEKSATTMVSIVPQATNYTEKGPFETTKFGLTT